MKRIVTLAIVSLCILLSAATAHPRHARDGEEAARPPLTNKDVVSMVKAKIAPEVIVQKIETSRCHFDTMPNMLAELRYQGVPDSVLMAMVKAPYGAPKAAPPAPAPEPERDEPASRPANTGGVIYHASNSRRPDGRRVFVAPMDEGFDGLITAQLLSKKIPVVISADEAAADYIITGGTNKGVHKWYDTVITGYERDRVQGSIRLIRVSDKTVVWASDAGDRSFWWGPLKKGGRRKVAERLVNKMKDKLFKDEW
jgi:hypothetical protein